MGTKKQEPAVIYMSFSTVDIKVIFTIIIIDIIIIPNITIIGGAYVCLYR